MSPVHIAPLLRSRESALESQGMQKPINSDGYNVHVSEENAGKRPKLTPVSKTFSINGKNILSTE